MPETLTPIEKLEAKVKEFGAESLEKIQSEWEGFLNLVDQALESPGEATKAAAKRVVQKTIDLIKKYDGHAAQTLQEDLEALLYEAEEVKKFVDKLSSYSAEDLNRFLNEHLELPHLSEAQKSRVDQMKVLYTVVKGCEGKCTEKSTANELLSAVAHCTREFIENPSATLSSVSRGLLLKLQALGSSLHIDGLYSLVLTPVNSLADLNSLRAKGINILRSIGAYQEAQLLALDTFPQESLAAEKKAANEIQTKWNESYNHALLELYQSFDELVAKTQSTQRARDMLDAAARAVADREMVFWGPLITLKNLDPSKLSADQKTIWNEINDMGDYKNEWFNVSDIGWKVGKEAFKQVAVLVATVLLPEIVALRAIELSGETLALLRSRRMAAFAKELLGARYGTLLGKAANYTGQLLVGQVVGEATFKLANAVTGQETLAEALPGRPWLENMLMGTLLEVPMELAVMMGGNQLTLAKEIVIGMTSSSLARLGTTFVQTGQKELCAYFFAGALKNGEYKGDPKKILEFCSEDLYEMCGCPQL